MERVNQSAQSALKIMRELVQSMAPSTSSLESFAGHLSDLAQQYLGLTRIKLHLDFPDQFPEIPLHAEARSNISMIITEALHNVVQHAQAREVRLRLQCQSQTLDITIQDDGRGFEPQANETVNSREGNGLRNLRSRALNLGGQMRIDTHPGQGTTLKFALPMSRLRAAN